MNEDIIKFGIAFNKSQWQVIKDALKFKFETAHNLGLVTYTESEHEIFKTINSELKILKA